VRAAVASGKNVLEEAAVKLFARHDLGHLADDEPVFLVRGRDAEGPNILRKLAFLVRARHGAEMLAGEIEAFADEMFAWQHSEGRSAPPPERDEAAPSEATIEEEPAPAEEPGTVVIAGNEVTPREETRR
jgi:hypothetical protein